MFKKHLTREMLAAQRVLSDCLDLTYCGFWLLTCQLGGTWWGTFSRFQCSIDCDIPHKDCLFSFRIFEFCIVGFYIKQLTSATFCNNNFNHPIHYVYKTSILTSYSQFNSFLCSVGVCGPEPAEKKYCLVQTLWTRK